MANQRDSSIGWVVAVSGDRHESCCCYRAMAFVPIGGSVVGLSTTAIPGEVRTVAGFRSDRYPFYSLCVFELFIVARKHKSCYGITISLLVVSLVAISSVSFSFNCFQ